MGRLSRIEKKIALLGATGEERAASIEDIYTKLGTISPQLEKEGFLSRCSYESYASGFILQSYIRTHNDTSGNYSDATSYQFNNIVLRFSEPSTSGNYVVVTLYVIPNIINESAFFTIPTDGSPTYDVEQCFPCNIMFEAIEYDSSGNVVDYEYDVDSKDCELLRAPRSGSSDTYEWLTYDRWVLRSDKTCMKAFGMTLANTSPTGYEYLGQPFYLQDRLMPRIPSNGANPLYRDGIWLFIPESGDGSFCLGQYESTFTASQDKDYYIGGDYGSTGSLIAVTHGSSPSSRDWWANSGNAVCRIKTRSNKTIELYEACTLQEALSYAPADGPGISTTISIEGKSNTYELVFHRGKLTSYTITGS